MKDTHFFALFFGLLILALFASQKILPPEPLPPFASASSLDFFTGRAAFEQGGAYANPAESFDIVKDDFLFGEQFEPRVADTIVYKYGYYAKDGGDWQQFTFTGTPVGGNWLQGPAQTAIPLGEGPFGAGENYVLAYGCTQQDRGWNCHEDKWMAHAFQIAPPAPPAPQCVSAADCPANNICSNGACVPLPPEPEAAAAPEPAEEPEPAAPPQPQACNTPADCPDGNICLGNVCIAAPQGPADLVAGQEQQAQQQVAQQPQQPAAGAAPITPATNDPCNELGQRQQINSAFHACVDTTGGASPELRLFRWRILLKQPCQNNEQCVPAATCERNECLGVTGALCGNDHLLCAAGLVCDAATQRCRPDAQAIIIRAQALDQQQQPPAQQQAPPQQAAPQPAACVDASCPRGRMCRWPVTGTKDTPAAQRNFNKAQAQVCANPMGVGFPCEENKHCAQGLSCVNNRCAAQQQQAPQQQQGAQQPAACVDASCDAGKICRWPVTGTKDTPAAQRNFNKAQAQVCANPMATGFPCERDAHCNQGLSCETGRCATQQPLYAVTVDLNNLPSVFMVSRDSGQHWLVVYRFIDFKPSTRPSCPTATTCFIGGQKNSRAVFAWTTNGGQLWETYNYFSENDVSINHLSCPTSSVCYLSTVSTLSNNNGGHLKKFTLPNQFMENVGPSNFAIPYNSLFCSDASTCFADALIEEDKLLLKTTDGGRNWDRTPFPSPTYCSGTACYDLGGASHSLSDVQGRWPEIPFTDMGRGILGVSCSGNTCFFVGSSDQNGVIYKRSGQERPVKLNNVLQTIALQTVSCPTASLCVVGGFDRILRTANAGQVWNTPQQAVRRPNKRVALVYMLADQSG